MTETTCYRELTRKKKFKELSFSSWIVIICIGFFTWFFLFFYAFLIVGLLYAILFFLEYLDEDFYQIFYNKLSIKENKYYA